jgi:spore coat polysaccharide biosynthesis protein SpsF
MKNATPPLVIVQARMGSTRLPGKSLMAIAGKTILGHTLEAIAYRFPRTQIVVATSSASSSDPISNFCVANQFDCFRGDETNVASRFFDILSQRKPERFLRVSGDSPLLDPRTLVRASELQNPEVDLITTVGTFPSGLHVEGLRTSTFLESYPRFKDSADFEHVTRFFYDHSDEFNIERLNSPVPQMAHYKLSIDTPEDKDRVEKIFGAFSRPHFQYSIEEKCSIYTQLFKGKS